MPLDPKERMYRQGQRIRDLLIVAVVIYLLLGDEVLRFLRTLLA